MAGTNANLTNITLSLNVFNNGSGTLLFGEQQLMGQLQVSGVLNYFNTDNAAISNIELLLLKGVSKEEGGGGKTLGWASVKYSDGSLEHACSISINAPSSGDKININQTFSNIVTEINSGDYVGLCVKYTYNSKVTYTNVIYFTWNGASINTGTIGDGEAPSAID